MSKKDIFLGILGGMGPMAGVELQRRIIEKSPASKDKDHIRMICFNNTQIQDRTESYKNGYDYSSEIIDSFRMLGGLGVNIGVMACNTAHFKFDNICDKVGFQLISLIDDTFKYITEKCKGAINIGLLATDGTIKSKIYHNKFIGTNHNIIDLDNTDQETVTNVIYGKYGIKAGYINSKNKHLVMDIIYKLKAKGADKVILGCTELSLLGFNTNYVIDPMDIVSTNIVNLAYQNEEYAEGYYFKQYHSSKVINE